MFRIVIFLLHAIQITSYDLFYQGKLLFLQLFYKLQIADDYFTQLSLQFRLHVCLKDKLLLSYIQIILSQKWLGLFIFLIDGYYVITKF